MPLQHVCSWKENENWTLSSITNLGFSLRTRPESCVRPPLLCSRSAFLALTRTLSRGRRDSLCMSMMDTFQTELTWMWSPLSTERNCIPGQVCVRLWITRQRSYYYLWAHNKQLEWGGHLYHACKSMLCSIKLVSQDFLDLPGVILWLMAAPSANFHCIITHKGAIYPTLRRCKE